jgi:hypothetical protein
VRVRALIEVHDLRGPQHRAGAVEHDHDARLVLRVRVLLGGARHYERNHDDPRTPAN